MISGFRISGTAYFVPEEIETSEALAAKIGKPASWIKARTGVQERRVANLSIAEMGARAARSALGKDETPDLVINASLTPIQLIPDSSVFIQRALGFSEIPSFSIHATCLSFLVGLHHAINLLAMRSYRRILVVSAEQGTVCRDFDQPESAALIGDGAAAAVIEACEPQQGHELLGWLMKTWPEGAHLAEIKGFGTRRHPSSPETTASDNLFSMDGSRLYRMTVSRVKRLIDELLNQANLSYEDIDLVIPHQPSGPALAKLADFGFPEDSIVNIIGCFGNCIAASMPMALAIASETDRIKKGSHVLFVGTGAGLSAAGAIIRW